MSLPLCVANIILWNNSIIDDLRGKSLETSFFWKPSFLTFCWKCADGGGDGSADEEDLDAYLLLEIGYFLLTWTFSCLLPKSNDWKWMGFEIRAKCPRQGIQAKKEIVVSANFRMLDSLGNISVTKRAGKWNKKEKSDCATWSELIQLFLIGSTLQIEWNLLSRINAFTVFFTLVIIFIVIFLCGLKNLISVDMFAFCPSLVILDTITKGAKG